MQRMNFIIVLPANCVCGGEGGGGGGILFSLCPSISPDPRIEGNVTVCPYYD